jgi:hypothetical protein
VTRLVWLAAVVLAAACSPPGTPTGSGPATPPATAIASSTANATSPVTPPPDGGPGIAAPPSVALTVPGLGPLAGELGSYTWGGFISDSPWIVLPEGPRVRAGTELAVAVAGITADHWDAAWAPIANGRAGPDIGGGSGQRGQPIKVAAPRVRGSWSLRVEAWFGSQWHAAWFWRLEVQP